jgi:hypothetical protein
MAETTRPQLVSPRQIQTLQVARSIGGTFDIDILHAMEERDNQLIADEILNGPGSSTFVYSFTLQGNTVAGISVVGARHLANHYGGLKHRLVAATHKIGPMFTFTSFPAENMPMAVSCAIVPELADDDDYYAAICEMTDVKTGNSIQIERREPRYEERRAGGRYERPNYPTIAQSKCYRNAVLSLVPQDVCIQWKEAMLKLQKSETITVSVLDEKRGNVLRFAAQKAITLDRRAIEGLTLDQIAGLGDAAREGRLPAFVEAAKALGLEIAQGQAAEAPKPSTASPPRVEPGPTAAAERTNRRRAATAAPAETPPQTPANEAAKSDTPAGDAAPVVGGGDDAGGQPSPSGQRRRVNFEV